MDNKEITPITSEEAYPATFEEFKNKISKFIETNETLDKASDLYDKIPIWVRVIANFDPSGVSGAIEQILSDNRAKREKDSILLAIYGLGRAMYEIKAQLNEKPLLEDQIPTLTYAYFEKSKNARQSSKIEYFRKVWKYGLTDNSNTLEEKLYIYDIVESLTEEQILILKIIFDKQQRATSQSNEISIKELSETLDISSIHARQACINLQGKGLIYDAGIGKYNYSGPNSFYATDYINTIIKYIE